MFKLTFGNIKKTYVNCILFLSILSHRLFYYFFLLFTKNNDEKTIIKDHIKK
jgi:hypothetical protein